MKSRTPLGILRLVFVAIVLALCLKHEDAEGEANDGAGGNTALERGTSVSALLGGARCAGGRTRVGSGVAGLGRIAVANGRAGGSRVWDLSGHADGSLHGGGINGRVQGRSGRSVGGVHRAGQSDRVGGLGVLVERLDASLRSVGSFGVCGGGSGLWDGGV